MKQKPKTSPLKVYGLRDRVSGAPLRDTVTGKPLTVHAYTDKSARVQAKQRLGAGVTVMAMN
jgi:hypothetical protein